MRARHVFVLLSLLYSTTGPVAADPRSVEFRWEQRAFPESCLNATLIRQGQANFEVNFFPIPTYTLSLSSDKRWGLTTRRSGRACSVSV
jgi:hypothetical protein